MKKNKLYLLFCICFVFLLASCDKGQNLNRISIIDVISSSTGFGSVTLKNTSGKFIDITGYTIGNYNSPYAYLIAFNTFLNPDENIQFLDFELGIIIADFNETIYLNDANGFVVDTWQN